MVMRRSHLLLLALACFLWSEAACVAASTAAAPTSRTSSTRPKLPPAPPGLSIRQDVAYLSAERSETLDLYLPSARDPAPPPPAIVIIHGGGWIGGDKGAGREFKTATTFVDHGYVCVSVNYLLGKGSWPTNL